VNEDAGGR